MVCIFKILIFLLLVGRMILLGPGYAQSQPERDYQTSTRLPIYSWKEYIEDSPYYFLEQSKEVILNQDWSVDETTHYRIKIQKDSARYLGEQKILYNRSREEILDIQAHVETPDGNRHPYTMIQDLDLYQNAPMYSDLKIKVITLPQVNIGSVIDVKVVSRTQHEIIRDHFSRQETYPGDPHQIYRAKYVLPKKMRVRFKELNPSVKAVHRDDGENEIYFFEHKRTMKEIESFLPPYNEVYGISSFSSMPDWGGIAQWYRDLVEKNTIPNDEISRKVQELIAGRTTEKDKARAILEFMQDEFRYVSMSFGDNAVEPHPTDQIFKNRYGDCKDWSILAKQMFELAGLKANICIFQNEYGGDPRWSLPSIALFNHVILEVTADGERYYIDPQLKYFDFGEYPAQYNNAFLYVIETDGYRFDTIPIQTQEQALTTIKARCLLDGRGGAEYVVHAALGTSLSNMMRVVWDHFSKDGKDMFFEGLEKSFARGGKVSDPQVEGMENRYGPIQLRLKSRNPNAYQRTSNLLIIHEPLSQYFPNPFVDKRRRYPIFVPSEDNYRIYISYVIPAGWEVESIPENFSFANDLLELSRKIVHRKGVLYALHVFRMKRGRWPAERYSELTSLYQKYYKTSNDAIVLRAKSAK